MQTAKESSLCESRGGSLPLVDLEVEACEKGSTSEEGVVSFHTELPIALQAAMTSFIERYPNWDQYRLIQAALAGFLVQNGVESRSITRLYIGNMFGSEALMHEV